MTLVFKMLNHWETKQLITITEKFMNFTQLQIFVQVNVQQTRVVTFMLKCSQRFKSTRMTCVEFQIRNIYLVLSLKQRWAERLYADGPVRLWGQQHHVNKSKPLLIRCDKFSLTDLKQTFILLTRFCLNPAQNGGMSLALAATSQFLKSEVWQTLKQQQSSQNDQIRTWWNNYGTPINWWVRVICLFVLC